MGACTRKRTFAWRRYFSDVSAAAEGSNLLSTIAPSSPTPLLSRSSSVMLFSRSEASGISQKSVILACSSTTAARFSAASPLIWFQSTLHHQGTRQWYEKHREWLGRRDQRGGLPQSVHFRFLSAGADRGLRVTG